MAKPNYQYEKRQRELAKKRKNEEKRLRKLAQSEKPPADSSDTPRPEDVPPQGSPTS